MLEALPAELRLQVEQSWACREEKETNHPLDGGLQPLNPKSRLASTSCPPPALIKSQSPAPPAALVLQIPNQPDSPGIVLELPNYSQVHKLYELMSCIFTRKKNCCNLRQCGFGAVKAVFFCLFVLKRSHPVLPVSCTRAQLSIALTLSVLTVELVRTTCTHYIINYHSFLCTPV